MTGVQTCALPISPEGAKKHGFGLIVPMVGEHQQCAPGIRPQGRMARLPRRRLEPARVITPDHHLTHRKGNIQALAEPSARLRPRGRTGNQPMTDMDRRELKAERLAQTGEDMQENTGIEPAAQADPELGRRDGKLPPLTGDSSNKLSRRQFP